MQDFSAPQFLGSRAVVGSCVALLVLAAACLPPRGYPQERQHEVQESPGAMGAVREVTIPPLDASAPSNTETATFALG
jgi:hypothetical protein